MRPDKKGAYIKTGRHSSNSAHRRADREFRSYDTSLIRPKRNPVVIVISVVVALVVLLAAAIFIHSAVKSLDNGATTLADGQVANITITEGEPAAEIAKSLLEAQVISSEQVFLKKASDQDAASQFKVGTYEFTGPVTTEQVIEQLIAGPNITGPSYTVPEGSTIAEVAAIVEQATLVNAAPIAAADFIALAHSASTYAGEYEFLNGIGNESLEGFLFPKTYEIASEASADSVIRQMLTQYGIETAALDYTAAAEEGLNAYDVLKLASIIEGETDGVEYGKISSVFHNRLAIDMLLESDATTAYEIGREPKPEDLTVDTPYNTYIHKGLTPTPICSPGLKSIQAALAPESTNYLYFYYTTNTAEGGKTFFSETYEQHEQIIEDTRV